MNQAHVQQSELTTQGMTSLSRPEMSWQKEDTAAFVVLLNHTTLAIAASNQRTLTVGNAGADMPLPSVSPSSKAMPLGLQLETEAAQARDTRTAELTGAQAEAGASQQAGGVATLATARTMPPETMTGGTLIDRAHLQPKDGESTKSRQETREKKLRKLLHPGHPAGIGYLAYFWIF